MKVTVGKNTDEMAFLAAGFIENKLNDIVSKNGHARLLLSTGESQLAVINHLREKNIQWDKIEIFHLDEYVGMPETHKASFRKYLKERIVDVVSPKKMHYVSGEGDIAANISAITKEIRKAPIDLALIGIGENAHIAFNDPPADFDTTEAFIVVKLDDGCKKQQVGEGWFASVDDVPNEAISITVYQMMQSSTIVSIVPGKRKAEAVQNTLEASGTTNMIPATKLKEHKDWHLFLDTDSASLADPDKFKSL